MKQNVNLKIILLSTAIILFAVVSRIINAEVHWYNFSPLVAMGLFSGAVFKNKAYAYLLPLAAYFLSDLYLHLVHHTGFYGPSQYFVYGGMALVVLLGTFIHKISALRIAGFAISGSLLFWVISNFGVFCAGYYGYSLGGLKTTYLMALPFYTHDGISTQLFFNAILGDLIFSGIFFGAYVLFRNKVTSAKLVA